MKSAFLLPVLMAGLAIMPADKSTAQTFTVMHSFTEFDDLYHNSDGANPYYGLILSGNTLYGTARYGGSSGNGTLFAVNTDGTGFATLRNFLGGNDGYSPFGGLVLSGNRLYGTTFSGGNFNGGKMYAVNTNGTGFTTLHSFSDQGDGRLPGGKLLLSGNSLYGTSAGGSGTVFVVATNGAGFTTLHAFTAIVNNTNSDGAYPNGGLVLSGNTLYGTTGQGGTFNGGTVFAVNTNGAGFSVLHAFSPYLIGVYGGLAVSGGTLYGVTAGGGDSGQGAVFSLSTDGTHFTNIYSFPASSTNSTGAYTNSDGNYPVSGLILSGNTLYGTADGGGSSGNGTVFALKTDGSGFTTLHSFSASSTNTFGTHTNRDGLYPSELILSGNTLYGTARYGGSSGNGTVFSVSLPVPKVTILHSGSNVVLTWPATAAGFTLQTAPTVTGPFTNLPAATSPYTNPISGGQQFFRLISN